MLSVGLGIFVGLSVRNSWVETIVGAAVILVALVFLIMGYRETSVTTYGNAAIYKGTFESVDGISLNSEVKMGGVKVGSVSSIVFDENNRVVVAISVRSDLKLPDDSTLAISSSGFLGDKYIEIIPGVSTSFLSSGDPFFSTKAPLNLESLINKVVLALAKKN